MAISDKRRKILDAAIQVFSRYGYYNSKVSQVAREAGVADGTIYLYFKSKEDILLSLFVDTMGDFFDTQEAALVGIDDPVEQLRTFVRVHFDAVCGSPAIAEIVTVELRQSAKFMRATDMKPFGRYLSIIARIISAGQERGVFARQFPARRVARMLFGVLDELALEWAMSERHDSLDEVTLHTAEIFVRGLEPRPTSGRGGEE